MMYNEQNTAQAVSGGELAIASPRVKSPVPIHGEPTGGVYPPLSPPVREIHLKLQANAFYNGIDIVDAHDGLIAAWALDAKEAAEKCERLFQLAEIDDDEVLPLRATIAGVI
jgi:hypothetical protein